LVSKNVDFGDKERTRPIEIDIKENNIIEELFKFIQTLK
jgi:hypothetical protein